MNSLIIIIQHFDFMFATEIFNLSFQYQEKSSHYFLDTMRQTMAFFTVT